MDYTRAGGASERGGGVKNPFRRAKASFLFSSFLDSSIYPLERLSLRPWAADRRLCFLRLKGRADMGLTGGVHGHLLFLFCA